MTENTYAFSGFKFSPCLGRLWMENKESKTVRRKTSNLLERLLANAGHLVTRDDLLESIWGDTHINEEGLTNCIFEAREALGDNPRQPQFIETVHGRGYRFIGPVTMTNNNVRQQVEPTRIWTDAPALLVGRERELETLFSFWKRCLGGRRGFALISGEQGAGKTALADHLLNAVQSSQSALVGRGQCFPDTTEEGSYLPIFEALGQICRGIHSEEVREKLNSFAPGWASRMPEIFDVEPSVGPDRGSAQRSSSMLGEIVRSLEALSATHPILLVCEDLQFADHLTVELLAYLALRRETAKLLVIATYRCVNQADQRRLRELLSRLAGQASFMNIELEGLSQEAISLYLRKRLSLGIDVERVARQLSLRSGGNPLLLAQLTEDLIARQSGNPAQLPAPDDAHEPLLPAKVRLLIEHQLRSLSDAEREDLVAASVVAAISKDFSAALVCAALGYHECTRLEAVESRCHKLGREGGFLRSSGVSHWPDGTTAGTYSFSRSLYQEVLYTSINVGGRARMHQLIADRLEKGWSRQLWKVRANLVKHLERAGDPRRAARYRHAVPGTSAYARTLRRNAVGYL